MMDREAEVAQLRQVDFKTGGDGPTELYNMIDAVLKAVGLDDPANIEDKHFTIALAACLVMIVLIWPRQIPPAWKYDKNLVCDTGSCVKR